MHVLMHYILLLTYYNSKINTRVSREVEEGKSEGQKVLKSAPSVIRSWLLSFSSLCMMIKGLT